MAFNKALHLSVSVAGGLWEALSHCLLVANLHDEALFAKQLHVHALKDRHESLELATCGMAEECDELHAQGCVHGPGGLTECRASTSHGCKLCMNP